MKKLYIILAVCFLIGNKLNSQVTLVNDLNPGSNSSTPDALYLFNNRIYFTAGEDNFGIEVYKHNPGGSTVLWNEVNPGAGSSTYPNFGTFNNKLYFAGYEDTYGNELYQYDTLNNLTRLSDICGSSCNSIPSGLIEFNGKLYFAANGPGNDFELYEYDGINPPVLTANINPTGNSYPFEKIIFNSKMYFHADDGVNGSELWVYDGVNPPSMLMDIRTGSSSSSPQNFIVYNSKLYFSANDGSNGVELWSYDGVNPPTMVINMETGALSFSPKYPFEFNGKLVFCGTRTSPGNDVGEELFSYDGINPPALVMDINSGSSSSSPRYFVELNGVLYFRAGNADYGREIWAWDGTNNPYLAYDVNPGTTGSSPNWDYNARKNIVAINNTLYFAADAGTVGEEFYKVTPCLITPTVNQVGVTLTATETGLTYQWIDCNNGNLPISGETNQSFTATSNGQYAVILNNGICADTSACITVNSVGIDNESYLQLNVYPNPASNFITIELNEEFINAKAEILNALGQVISIQTINSKTTSVQLPENDGIYFIRLSVDNKTKTTRIINQ